MIRKLSKTVRSMEEKQSKNVSLPKKRLVASEIALAMLKTIWQQSDFHYSVEEVQSAQQTLLTVKPSIESQLPKFEENTPQHTIATRRLLALDIVDKYFSVFIINTLNEK